MNRRRLASGSCRGVRSRTIAIARGCERFRRRAGNARCGRATGVSSGANLALASVGMQRSEPGATVAVHELLRCSALSQSDAGVAGVASRPSAWRAWRGLTGALERGSCQRIEWFRTSDGSPATTRTPQHTTGRRPRPARTPSSSGVSSSYRGLPPFQPARPKSGASQAQLADLVQHPGTNEIQQISGFAGDGETRTRTGDTTIFSLGAETLELPRNACKGLRSARMRLAGRCPQIAFFRRRFGHRKAARCPMRWSYPPRVRGRTSLYAVGRPGPQPGNSGVRCVQGAPDRPYRPRIWTIWTQRTAWMLPRCCHG
jgi:hypothetical protein